MINRGTLDKQILYLSQQGKLRCLLLDTQDEDVFFTRQDN